MPITIYPNSLKKRNENGTYSNIVPGIDYTNQIFADIADGYSSQATYAVGDYCIHSGALYRCITAISTAEAWTAAHWTSANVGDELTGKVDKVPNKGLSTEDYTAAEKTKLSGIEAQANKTVIDNTLTQTGQAADAKATGDEVSELKNTLTYNEECDRLGLIPYACNGSNTNVLSVVQNGNEVTVNGTSTATSGQGFTKILLVDHIYSWNASSVPATEQIYPLYLINGHTYKLKAHIVSGTRDAGGGNGRLWAGVFDASGVLASAVIAITETDAEVTYQSSGEYIQLRMLVGRLMNVTNLVIRIELSDITIERALDEKQDILVFDNTPTEGSTNPVTSDGIYTSVKEQIERATGATILEYVDKYGIELGAVGSTATPDSPVPKSSLSYAVGSVSQGQKIKCKLTNGSSSYRAYAFLDKDNVILEKATSNSTEGEYTLIAPAGSAKVVINALTSHDHWTVIVHQELPWSGLYVSLLGDSISSLQGYVPSGNETYYGPSKGTEYQRSITTPAQMWWYQVIDTLGGTPLIIDAWSGSSVTQGGGDTGTTEMSAVSRCQNLHAWVQTTSDDPDAVEVTSENIGSMRTSPFLSAYTPTIGNYAKKINPDIVLSTGGTNDWTYATTPEAIGTYDGHTGLPNPNGNEPAVTTFREAYATMLCRIQEAYPFALTICCKGFFNMRPYVAKYNGNKNTDSGLTIQDYSKAIDEIAAIRACPVIDVWTNGFNKYNYYDTFAGDRETTTTHPNVLGHQMIAENSIPHFKNVCAGYIQWLKTRNSI